MTNIFRLAEHKDAAQIADLFLIRFPWLNNNWMGNAEPPKERVLRNINEQLDSPEAITIVGEYCGALSLVLRCHVDPKEKDRLIIDSFCTNDSIPAKTRARIILGATEVLHLVIDFARRNGIKEIGFDTHVSHLPSATLNLFKRMQLELRSSDNSRHSYCLLPHDNREGTK